MLIKYALNFFNLPIKMSYVSLNFLRNLTLSNRKKVDNEFDNKYFSH